MRRSGWVALCAAVLLAVFGFGVGWGDRSLFPPSAGAGRIAVLVVSNGYHSGIVVPRPALAEAAGRAGAGAALSVATRFLHYDEVEVGWGEERFYREVPTIDALNWRLALRALFAPGNASVLHVVGIEGGDRTLFRGADLVRVELSREGFDRLVQSVDRSFARDGQGQPEALGPGLYGPSLFYRATEAFSALNVCNHWTARLLAAAGVPTSPLLATLPDGLLLDLRLRSGLRPEREALPVSARTQ